MLRLLGDSDGAWRDFERAGQLGNAFAKREAVRLNPYSAMCNQMLQAAAHQLLPPTPGTEAGHDSSTPEGSASDSAPGTQAGHGLLHNTPEGSASGDQDECRGITTPQPPA